jgi:PPOX class probable F420-dependent enzyme
MSEASMTVLDRITPARHVSLTTFGRNGRPVPTPVGFVVDVGELFVLTLANTGKVKRIRDNPTVVIAPCHTRGHVAHGAPTALGKARLLDNDETAHARKLMSRKYPVARVVFWGAHALLRRAERLHGASIAVGAFLRGRSAHFVAGSALAELTVQVLCPVLVIIVRQRRPRAAGDRSALPSSPAQPAQL